MKSGGIHSPLRPSALLPLPSERSGAVGECLRNLKRPWTRACPRRELLLGPQVSQTTDSDQRSSQHSAFEPWFKFRDSLCRVAMLRHSALRLHETLRLCPSQTKELTPN